MTVKHAFEIFFFLFYSGTVYAVGYYRGAVGIMQAVRSVLECAGKDVASLRTEIGKVVSYF